MMIRGKGMALSLLAVGTAAAAGYVLRSSRTRARDGQTRADVGARIVEEKEIPDDATVVDVSSRRLQDLPAAGEAIERAVRNDARDEWEHVTLERDDAWHVVDALRASLPYHDADGAEYNGVYVHCDGRVVVLDAFGWVRLEEPIP